MTIKMRARSLKKTWKNNLRKSLNLNILRVVRKLSRRCQSDLRNPSFQSRAATFRLQVIAIRKQTYNLVVKEQEPEKSKAYRWKRFCHEISNKEKSPWIGKNLSHLAIHQAYLLKDPAAVKLLQFRKNKIRTPELCRGYFMKMWTFVSRTYTRPVTHINIRMKFGSLRKKMKHRFLILRVPKILATKKGAKASNWQKEREAEVPITAFLFA